MRGVEDEAGVPHGSARHHFGNQHGLVLAMVRHLLAGDLPEPGESLEEQFARWLGAEAGRTRARYELTVASFHDPALAAELVRGRERLVAVLCERGPTREEAALLTAALDGLVLDALLRRRPPESVDPQQLAGRFSFSPDTPR